jgi:hypothetical protein
LPGYPETVVLFGPDRERVLVADDPEESSRIAIYDNFYDLYIVVDNYLPENPSISAEVNYKI